MTNVEIQEFVSLNSDIKKIITSKVISDLENIVQPDEILIKSIQGKPHTAILLSNTRLLFITNGVFGIKIESEYFNAIKSASHKKGLISASIQIQASKSRSYPVDQPQGLQFIEALNAKLAQNKLDNPSKKPQASGFLAFVAIAVVVFAFYVNSKDKQIINEAPSTTQQTPVVKKETVKTFNIKIDQYTKNVNAMFKKLKLPYKFKGKLEKGEVNDSVVGMLSDNHGILVSIDKKTQNVLGVIFTASGDGTPKSGAEIMLMAIPVTRAVLDADEEKGGPIIGDLLTLSETPAEITKDGVRYSFSHGEGLPAMFAVEKE